MGSGFTRIIHGSPVGHITLRANKLWGRSTPLTNNADHQLRGPARRAVTYMLVFEATGGFVELEGLAYGGNIVDPEDLHVTARQCEGGADGSGGSIDFGVAQ